jgi:hypothetical protein
LKTTAAKEHYEDYLLNIFAGFGCKPLSCI